MGILSEEQKKTLKQEFEDYKKGRTHYPLQYQERYKQLAFCNFARRLIKVVCSSPNTTRHDLASLLTITRANTKLETTLRHLEGLKIDENEKQSLIKEIENLSKEGIGGYVWYPKQSIWDDLDFQYLKNLLLKILKETDELKQRHIVADIDQAKIKGFWPTYLPSWLYYINPKLFPIVAKVNMPFLQKYGLDNDLQSYQKVIDLFKEILDIVNEEDMGIIDSFAYPETYFEGFSEEDFENLENIRKINNNPNYWDDNGNEYINKDKELEAEKLAKGVSRHFKKFKKALNIKFQDNFESKISRTRAQGIRKYKSLFWIYYFKSEKGEKNAQAQLQISIGYSKFCTAELWFELEAKEDRNKLADFLLKNPINFNKLKFRVWNEEKNDDEYVIPAILPNIPKFVESLRYSNFKLGIVSEYVKNAVIELQDKIVEKCQQDLEFIYDNLYAPVFESGVLVKKKAEIEVLNDVQDLLITKKQIILYGPPGTGKTFKTREYAVTLMENIKNE